MISITRRRTLTGILAASIGALGVAIATGAGTVAPSFEDGVKVGDKAPEFTLTDIHGEEHSLSDYEGKIVVLEWFNPDCPFVKKHYDSKNMQELQKEMAAKDVQWLLINSSAVGKQGNCDPARARELIKENGISASSFLLDHDGKVGHAYGAKTTPHMFVIDKEGTLVYNGAIDDNPSAKPEDARTAHNLVRAAVNEVLAGSAVTKAATQPYGCGVKYADKK